MLFYPKVFVFLAFCTHLLVALDARNITVGPDDPLGISGAISSVSGGEAVVYVMAGNYTGKNNCDLLIQNNNFNFTLIGIQGSNSTTIDCGHQSRCLKIVGGGSVKIVGIHFRNGQAPNLPQNNNNLLRNSNPSRKLLFDSDGGYRGVDNRDKIITSSKTNPYRPLPFKRQSDDGDIPVFSVDVSIDRNGEMKQRLKFHKKAARTTTIKNNNKATKTMIVDEDNSNIIVPNNLLRDSSSDGITGGCVFISQGANVEMIDVQVSGGKALNGSGIGALDSTVSIDGCLITSNGISYRTDNISIYGGGAFMRNCSVAMKNSIIENNFCESVGKDTGVYGCGVYIQSCKSTVLTESIIIRCNRAFSSNYVAGVGIVVNFTNNILFNGSMTIFNNSAKGYNHFEGAGILLYNCDHASISGDLSIGFNSIEVRNGTGSVTPSVKGAGMSIFGGGATFSGSIDIRYNSIVVSGSTDAYGAGLYCNKNKQFRMIRPTVLISGNSITNIGSGKSAGAGVYFLTVSSVKLKDVTITNNSIVAKTDIFLASSGIAVHNAAYNCEDSNSVHETDGVIRTNASTSYSSNSNCEWGLSASPTIQQLKYIYSINVTRIDIEYEASCSYDWLAFYDGDTSDAPLIGKYCGSYPPNPNQNWPLNCVEGDCPDIHDIVSSGGAIIIQFISDGATEGTGFRIEWHMIPRNESTPIYGSPADITDSLLNALPYAAGGGIGSLGSTITIINSIISNNIVNATYMALGGGIGDYAASRYQIINSTIDGNVATAVIGGGGGIALQSGSKFDIYNSTISNNAAIGYGECFWFGDGGQCPTGIGGGILALHGSLKTSGQTQITSNIVDCYSSSCAGRGGGVAVSLNATVIMTNGTSIDYNQCGTNDTVDMMLYGNGGGLYANSGYIEISSNSSVSHSIIAERGRGGGVRLSGDCEAQISDSIISMNNANEGGGIWFQDYANVNVASCYIFANNATVAGAIGMKGSANAIIADTIIENNTASQLSSIGGYLDNDGYISIDEGIIVGDASSQCLVIGTCSISTTWNCNENGSVYKKTDSDDFFSFNFLGCDAGTYWLGKASSNSSSSINETICHVCPVGAKCTGATKSSSGLLALTAYWGYDVGNGVAKFSPCPDGYCCQNDQCSPYNYCEGKRHGMLCGSCIPDYSIQFFSESCAPNHQCHHASWFIPVLFIIFVVIVVLLVSYSTFTSDGMISSLVFFYQASPLAISVNTKSVIAPVSRILRSIFNLTPQSDGSDAIKLCLFPNMSRSTKFGLEIACYALFLIACCFVWMIHILMKKTLWNKKIVEWMDRHPPDAAVYLAAMTKILSFGYITITINTMSMLQCDDFGDGRQRWFFDGDVECLTSWQKIAIAMSIILFSVPFVVTGIVMKWGHGFGIGKIKKMIRQVLVSPYKMRRWWWAGMLMGKRLLISIAYTWTWTNGWRSTAMFILCSVMLAAQFRARPHAHEQVQKIDNMGMLLMCVMTALSVKRLSYQHFGFPIDDIKSETAVEIFQLLMFLTPGLTVGFIYLKQIHFRLSNEWKKRKFTKSTIGDIEVAATPNE